MKLFSATVTHSATAKSKVVSGDHRVHLQVRQGGTLAGTTKGQINNMTEREYAIACGFTMEESLASREAKELANDVGWFDESFLISDATNPAATLVLAAGIGGAVNLAPGPTRRRFVHTTSAGTGVLDIDASVVSR
jgi:hypothetical protein